LYITMRIPTSLPRIDLPGPAPLPASVRKASISRRLAFITAVCAFGVGLLSLVGWFPGADDLLFADSAFQAPRPSRGVMILLNAAVLLLLALRHWKRARQAAYVTIAVGGVALVFALLQQALPIDQWILQQRSVTSLPSNGTLTIVQAGLALVTPAAVLLLARPRVTESALLLVTALGMTLVGGALLISIVHAAQLNSGSSALMGTVSFAGLVTAVFFGTTIFLLVADRQSAPRVPPRWSPEMAAALAVVCTIALCRALDGRVGADGANASLLSTLALLLGLAVSALLYLSLRLLRSNWLQAQRLAHANLSRAFETATDGVWEYEFETRHLRRSEAQLRHLGYDPALVNRTPGAWLALVHPDDREQVVAHEQQRRASRQETGELTYRVRTASGDYHTIIDRGRIVEHAPDGSPRLIIGISADVTERERADRERQESERRFRAIFDSALQGQVLLDESGVCLEVNGTALAIVGAQRHDVLRLPLAVGPWFTGLSEAQARVESALGKTACGLSVRFEAETHLLDGRIGRLECSMTPLQCDAGRVLQVLVELRDVTDRRRSEEALREIGALTTIGRLAARVAHEINNPLAGIQNAFLLLGDAVPAEHPHRRFLQSIDREIQRIASVTRSLYETYRQDAAPGASGSMALAVHDAVSFLDQVNRSRNIRIRTDLRRAPALVPVPDALLRQTLYNLVQNAVEASPVGGEVSIVVDAVGDECIITVHDEGAKVPDHLRERIFEPMSGARTAALRTGSMGIGLSLVRQSVRALGGTVTLLDGQEHGATFEVRLPMTSVLHDTDETITRTAHTPSGTTAVDGAR
jgi:two-component system, sporulation sensor kinase C